MLHRVAPFEDKLTPNENMKVTPTFLEQFIVDSLQSGYVFISLDELHYGLLHQSLPEYFICITLDDGYKDNLTYAYPIFAKYNIPFCIYICTSFPQSTHSMWWFGLEDYLLSTDYMEFQHIGYDLSSKESKEMMFLTLRHHIITHTQSYEDGEEIMRSLNIPYNPRAYDSLALTWEDIKLLDTMGGGDKNLCTIGAHTHSHPILNQLSQKQVIDDITLSQQLFTQYLGYIPKHFAYPFGSRLEVDSSYFSIIPKLGFATATTTRRGCIYPQHKNHLYALPRIFFGEHFMIQSAFRIRKKRIVTT